MNSSETTLPLNRYETKFKEALINNKTFSKKVSDSIKECSNKLNTIEKTISSLETAVTALSDQIVIDALEKQITLEKQKHQQLVNTQQSDLKNLDRYRNELKFLQGLCPHVNSKVRGHDYHHNFDNYRCDLCLGEF